VFGLLAASSSFSMFVVNWSRQNISSCFMGVNSQVQYAYASCLGNCESFSFNPIYALFMKGYCYDDCVNNLVVMKADVFKYGRCQMGCLDKYASVEYGKCYGNCSKQGQGYSCTNACFVSSKAYAPFIGCASGCRSDLGAPIANLSAWDRGYISCMDRYTVNVTEKKGFLYLPYESTKGLKINTGWNYTNEVNSCGNYTSNSYHGGIDFDKVNDVNVSIVAAAGGNVTKVVKDCGTCGKSTGYGAYVKIRSVDPATGIKYLIVYGHMQNMSIKVTEGQEVAAGDALGLMGTTGDSTGSHLHFEVRKNEDYDNRVDPYDIRSIDECEYPGWSKSFKDVTCGPEYLWTECPPVPKPVSN